MKKNLTILLLAACSFFTLTSCEKNFETLSITSSTPVNNSKGVLPEFYAEIEFNNEVNRTDIEENFSISGNGDVPGNFQWISGNKFRFVPSDPVTVTGRYVMEIPRSVRDKDGNTMDTDFISDFYIGNDFISPVILSSNPPCTTGAADNIPINRNITVNFSKSMNREGVEKSFSITPDVAGYFVWSENVPGLNDSRFTYTLLADMIYGKLYSFTLSKSSCDTSGNSISSDYRVNFITGDDFTPPQIKGIYDSLADPAADPSVYWLKESVNDAVSRNVKIAVDFSEPMDRASVESAFSIIPSVPGNCKWDSDIKLVFIPASPFNPETNYQINIDKTAKDINGLKLDSIFNVEIKTTGLDSQYVKCGNITGSGDNSFTDPPFSAGIPAASTWPLIITMSTVPIVTIVDIDGVPTSITTYSQDYYIKIQFVSALVPYTPVEVNKYSVIDNARIETFKSGPIGVNVKQAGIVNINWVDNSTVIFKFNPMTNKLLLHTPALYRLTLTGGSGGIKDKNGNFAERDIVLEFREAL